MRKKLTLVLLCLTCSFSVFAQQKLSGTVSDADANPVAGASVIEKGTNNGTVTDAGGNFSLTVSSSGILQISHLGYEPVEIPVGNRAVVEVTLENTLLPMDEVIVVGYGTIKKADLSGSVANVSGDRLTTLRSTSVSQALQGTMPGVTVTRTNSLPGASATIRVRGITTINDSNPLIIVDGIPGDLNMMDADDIESISVLKDAAAASIYGVRAAAGVILVTTKKAKEGNLNIEYNGNFGWVVPADFPETVDYKRYMEMTNEITWNDADNKVGSEHTLYSPEYIAGYYENHLYDPDRFPIADWTKYIVKNSAPTMKHNVSMAYGGKVANTRASIGYESTDGLYNNRNYKAVTARLSNDVKIAKWLSASVDASYRRGISENANINPLVASYMYAPLWSPVYSDGRISGGRDGTNTYARLNYSGFNNSWSDNITGKFAINFMPVKGLTVTGVYAPNITLTKGKQMTKQVPYYSLDDPDLFVGYVAGCLENSLAETRGETREVTRQVLANYTFSINKEHNFHLLAGYEDYTYYTESLSASSKTMEISDYEYLNLANPNDMTVGGTAVPAALYSYFGRVTYDYKNRYLFQANIRVDYSSYFDRDFHRGIFPSFSAGWVISEENFMKGVNTNILSFLKLRGSYGSLGNDRVGPFKYAPVMSFSNALFTNADGTMTSYKTAAQTDMNVKDISWETTGTWNVGVDLTLFSNKFTLTADYYKKMTRDMLMKQMIPKSLGYGNPVNNVGSMHTYGWEVQAGWRDRKGGFSYGINFNISDYRSIMDKLTGPIITETTITQEGSQFQEWYGYKTDGLFLTQEDRDGSPRISDAVRVGDVKYIDISGKDGVPDGVISSEYDRVPLGATQPRFMYGGSIDMQFKGFDLTMVFQGVGQRLVRVTSDMAWRQSAWHTFPAFLDGNYFSYYNTDEQNAKAKYPRVSEKGYTGYNYNVSDFWLINGAYFRMKNIVLGYTLPDKAAKWLHVAKVRVFVSGTDLFSIDKFPQGWDPETSTSGNSYISRSYNLGLSVKF